MITRTLGCTLLTAAAVTTLASCQYVLGDFQMSPTSSFVTCRVTRRECISARADSTCAAYGNSINFDATACPSAADGSNATACNRTFCGGPNENSYAKFGCSTQVIGNASALGSGEGICSAYASSTKAAIAYTQRYASCSTLANGACSTIGSAVLRSPPSAFECVDLSLSPAMVQVPPSANAPGLGMAPGSIWNPSVQITAISLNDSRCASMVGALSFTAPRSTLGSISSLGFTVPITASQTVVSTSNSCTTPTPPTPTITTPTTAPNPAGTTYDPPNEVPTCTQQIDDLKIALDDVSVGGVALTGMTATNVGATKLNVNSSGQGQIAAGGLKLAITGMINGAKSVVTVANRTPWTVNVGSAAMVLAGDIVFTATNSSQQPVEIQTTINAVAPLATAAQSACAAAGPNQKLFGFEQRAQWKSSNAALSFTDSPVTQGCGALAVAGQGYMTLESDRFATSVITLAPALSVDLFVPSNQPNPWWYGGLQMFIACPSGNVSNQYIGQVELTALPTGRFSTLRFALPAETTSTLQRDLLDCSIAMALNVNQTNENWILDNLRFTL